MIGKAQIPLVASRHVTPRYLAHVHAFWYRKKSYVLCRACCTASATQHVATNATSSSRRARQVRHATLFVMCIKLCTQ